METLATVASASLIAAAGLGYFSETITRYRRAERHRGRTNRPWKSSGLDILNPQLSRPEVDICFIHGLHDTGRETWTLKDPETNESVFWPHHLLSDKDLPAARILIYSYNIDVHTICWLAQRTLYHHAHRLPDALAAVRLDCPQRPLLFVVHSIGGLLLKSALSSASWSGDDMQAASSANIRRSTCGIISFGAPQTFTGHEVMVDVIDRLCGTDEGMSFDDYESRVWKTDIEELWDHLRNSHDLSKEIPELFCFEHSTSPKMTAFDISVPPARLGNRSIHELSEPFAISRSHKDLARFDDRKDRTYTKVRDTMKKFYDEHVSQNLNKPLVRAPSWLLPEPVASSIGFDIQTDLPYRPLHYIYRALLPTRERSLSELRSALREHGSAVILGPSNSGKTTLAYEYIRQCMESEHPPHSSFIWLKAHDLQSMQTSFVNVAKQITRHYEGQAQDSPINGTASEGRINHMQWNNHYMPTASDMDWIIGYVHDWLSMPHNSRWLLVFDEVTNAKEAYLSRFVPPVSMLRSRHGNVILTCDDERNPNLKSHAARIHMSPSQDKKRRQKYFGAEPGEDSRLSPGHKQPHDPSEGKDFGSFFDRHIRVDIVTSKDMERIVEDANKALAEQDHRKLPTGIANHLKDNPEDIALIGSFADQDFYLDAAFDTTVGADPDVARSEALPLLDPETGLPSIRGLETELFYDIASSWLDICMMLGTDPIPSVLIQTHSGLSIQQIHDHAHWLQRHKVCLYDERGSTVQILQSQRRSRVQYLKADARSGRGIALRACQAVIQTILRLSRPDERSTKLDNSREGPMLLNHVPACLDLVEEYQDVLCEWDILAEFCERYGRWSDAVRLYRFATMIRFENRNTDAATNASEDDVFHPALSDPSDPVDDWLEARSAEPEALWCAPSDPAYHNPGFRTNTELDTGRSRHIRSELGLLRMQLRLDEFMDPLPSALASKHGRLQSPDERCISILQRIKDRREPCYLSLHIDLLNQAIAIAKKKRSWPDAIRTCRELISFLEETHGTTARATMLAVQQLADVYLNQTIYHEALPLYRRVLHFCQDAFGVEDYRTVEVLERLALSCAELGNLEESRVLWSKIVELQKQRLGDEHEQTREAKSQYDKVCKLERKWQNRKPQYMAKRGSF